MFYSIAIPAIGFSVIFTENECTRCSTVSKLNEVDRNDCFVGSQGTFHLRLKVLGT